MVTTMNLRASPPRIETAAVSVAALSVGGAVAFAVARIAPLGAGLGEASGAGLIAALGAWVLVGRVDRRPVSPCMAKVARMASGIMEQDVLLLDQMVEDEPLLLDDPLPILNDDSRVVRLFAAIPGEDRRAPPLAGPGEMIARIEDFLGRSRGAPLGETSHRARKAESEDASAALHSALADIRRSLRQA